MATISEIRDAIADALNTIDGLRATGLITDQINPPQAELWAAGFRFDDVMHAPGEDAAYVWPFRIRVYVGRAAERSGQELLDELAEPVGDKSIKATLESDAALAALCDYVLVDEAGDILPMIHESGTQYLIRDFAGQVAL